MLRACYPASVACPDDDERRTPEGDEVGANPVRRTRRWTALVVALCCAASPPARAGQDAPTDAATAAEDRGQALYAEGKFREAGDALVEAYRRLPNDAAHRARRNAAVSQAINAYRAAFDADPGACEVARTALAVIERYIAELRVLLGEGTEATFEFQGVVRSRDDLGQAKTARGCAEPAAVEPAPAVTVPEAETRPAPPRSHARAFGVGLGLSAGVAIGMAIGGGVMFTRLRKPEGPLYAAVVDEARAAGVSTGTDTDMCAAGMRSSGLDEACEAWQGGFRGFVAMTALAGVFTASTAVFAGLLVRERQRWRRHEVQIGAAPRIGGAAVTAGFRF